MEHDSIEDLNKRVAVLEIQHGHLADKFEGVEGSIQHIVQKLDTHMVKTNDHITDMQISNAEATKQWSCMSKTIENATEILKEVSTKASDAHVMANKFDVISRTTVKIASGLGVVITALWALYKHFA